MGNEASAERLSDDSVSVQDDTSGKGKKMPNMVLIFERWIDAKPKNSLPTNRKCAPQCIVYLDGREIGKAISYPSEPISLLPRTPNSVLHFRFFEKEADEACSSSSTCLETKDCKSSSNEDIRELSDEPKSPPVAVVALDSNPDGVVDAEDPTEESNALDTVDSEGEEDIPALVQLRVPVSKFVMFGAPLYSSICLGLPIIEGSQEPVDLNDAVLHSSNWEVPKICMSLFKPNRISRKADAMPQPDIHAALAEEGGGGFCAAPIEHAVPPEVLVKGLINSSMSNALRMQDWGEMILKMESEMQALKADAMTKEEELKLQVTDTRRQLEALKKASSDFEYGRLRMEKEYQESEARFQQLSADLLSIEHERAQLQAQVDNIEKSDKATVMDAEEKERSAQEINRLQVQCNELLGEAAEQKRALEAFELQQQDTREIQAYQTAAAENHAIKELHQEKESLQQEIFALQRELDQVRAKAKAGEEAFQQLSEVKEQQEQELNSLKADIENAHQNIQEQNQKLQSLYDHEEQHKKEMDTITQDFQQANDRGLKASESLKTLALEKDQTHEELSALRQEHDQVKNVLTAQLKEANEVIKKLTVERDGHANQHALLAETILELEQTLAGQASLLQTRVNDAANMGSKAVAQLQHALTQANENVATLSQERDAAKMEARAYQGQVDALHTSIQREKKLLEEHAQSVLHQATSKMQSNIDALIKEKSGLEKQLTQTSATSQGLADMQATLDALRAEKCELERKLQQGTNDSKTLALLAENGDLHQQLAQAKAAEEAMKQEMTNLRNDNALRKEERASLLAEKRTLEKEFLELQDSARSKTPPPAQLAPQAPDTSLREAPDMIILKVFRRLIFEKFSSKNADELSRLLKMEGPSTSMRKADVDKVLKQYKKFKDEFDERKAFQKMDAHKAGSIPAAVFQDVLAKALYLDSQASDYIYAIIDGVLHGSHPLKRTQFSGVQFATQQAGEIEQENFVRLLSDPCMR